MARPLRIEAPNTFYHTLSRGNEKRPIFLDEKDYELFLGLLAEYSRRFHVIVYCYCLMKNHFHILLQTLEANLSEFMKHLLGVYTLKFNRRHDRVGHLFQGRYKSFVVDKEAYLLELSRYIHLNPCQVKMVEQPERYPWSSLPFYLFKTPPDYLDSKLILSEFPTPAAYRQFVMERMGNFEDPFSKAIGGVFLGSRAFVEKFKQAVAQAPSKEISRVREILRLDPEKVEEEMGHTEEEGLKIYALWNWAKLRQSEIGRRLGKTRSAICHSLCRFREQMKEDKDLRARVGKTAERLGIDSTFND